LDFVYAGLSPTVRILLDLFPWLDLDMNPKGDFNLTDIGRIVELHPTPEFTIRIQGMEKTGVIQAFGLFGLAKRATSETFTLNSIPEAIGVISASLPVWMEFPEFLVNTFQLTSLINKGYLLLSSPSGNKSRGFRAGKPTSPWQKSGIFKPRLAMVPQPRESRYKGVPLTVTENIKDSLEKGW
jgi:hypothetical protein